MEQTPPNPHVPTPEAGQPAAIRFGLSLRPARLIVVLLIWTAILSVLSLIANVMAAEQLRGAEPAVEFFSVDRENSLSAWWASLLLAAVGGLTWLVSRSRKTASPTEKLAWLVLAAGFVFLSIDECCMLHERLGRRVKLEGSLHHARWIFLWLPPAVLIAGVIFWRLWRASKQLVIGLTLGVVVFLGGAVGVEMFNASYRYQAEEEVRKEAQARLDAGETDVTRRDWQVGSTYYPYIIGTAIEELLEALGPVIWIAVLMRFYREQTAINQQNPDS